MSSCRDELPQYADFWCGRSYQTVRPALWYRRQTGPWKDEPIPNDRNVCQHDWGLGSDGSLPRWTTSRPATPTWLSTSSWSAGPSWWPGLSPPPPPPGTDRTRPAPPPLYCTVQYCTGFDCWQYSKVQYSSSSSLFHKFSAATELPDYWILPIPPGSPASTQGARSHAWVILLTTLITKTNIHVSKLFHLSKQFVNFIV